MEALHIAPNYFFNPTHPITISVIGVGGNGSRLISKLTSIDFALKELNHPGIHVKAFDADLVEHFNVGRQLFSIHDVGENKAERTITKVNRAFNLQWQGFPFKVNISNNTKNNYRNSFSSNVDDDDICSNIMITCVDDAKFRVEFSKRIKEYNYGRDYTKQYYWLDLGNSKSTGQFILGTIGKHKTNKIKGIKNIASLKNIIDMFPNITDQETVEIQGNGCSYNDKLNEQSLFINDTVAAHSCDLIFKLLNEKTINFHGKFINLDKGIVNSIPV